MFCLLAFPAIERMILSALYLVWPSFINVSDSGNEGCTSHSTSTLNISSSLFVSSFPNCCASRWLNLPNGWRCITGGHRHLISVSTGCSLAPPLVLEQPTKHITIHNRNIFNFIVIISNHFFYSCCKDTTSFPSHQEIKGSVVRTPQFIVSNDCNVIRDNTITRLH